MPDLRGTSGEAGHLRRESTRRASRIAGSKPIPGTRPGTRAANAIRAAVAPRAPRTQDGDEPGSSPMLEQQEAIDEAVGGRQGSSAADTPLEWRNVKGTRRESAREQRERHQRQRVKWGKAGSGHARGRSHKQAVGLRWAPRRAGIRGEAEEGADEPTDEPHVHSRRRGLGADRRLTAARTRGQGVR